MATFFRKAVLEREGDIFSGAGTVTGMSSAFAIPATYPRVSGEPAGITTPEEMLAASHAICFGIGLRGLMAQRGGRAQRVLVTATITAEKDAKGIRIRSSHLECRIAGLEGLNQVELEEIGAATEDGCTISNAIRGSVAITFSLEDAGSQPLDS
jgi:lipoyl-dependent peroxiredoxin